MFLPSVRMQPASFVVGPGFLPIPDKTVTNTVSGVSRVLSLRPSSRSASLTGNSPPPFIAQIKHQVPSIPLTSVPLFTCTAQPKHASTTWCSLNWRHIRIFIVCQLLACVICPDFNKFLNLGRNYFWGAIFREGTF